MQPSRYKDNIVKVISKWHFRQFKRTAQLNLHLYILPEKFMNIKATSCNKINQKNTIHFLSFAFNSLSLSPLLFSLFFLTRFNQLEKSKRGHHCIVHVHQRIFSLFSRSLSLSLIWLIEPAN